jgi:secreted Zn-dependent insulinase-like peptidase
LPHHYLPHFQNIQSILPAVASWVRVAISPASRFTFLKFWDTIRRLALLSSNFPSIPRASELPQQLASGLLRLGHHQTVSLDWTWKQPDSGRLETILSSVQLGRCLMMLTLPTNSPPVSFDGSVLSENSALPAGYINGTERWYGTTFLATGISLEQLRSIDDAGAHMDSRWKLPGENHFIPDDVSLVTGNTDVKPALIHSADTSGAKPSTSQVWHALDNSFGSPKQVCFIFFILTTMQLQISFRDAKSIHGPQNLVAVLALGNVLLFPTGCFCLFLCHCFSHVKIDFKHFIAPSSCSKPTYNT